MLMAQKLSSNHELKQAVVAASNIAKMPVSPKNMKKKNKNKDKSQGPLSNAQKIDTNPQKPTDQPLVQVNSSVKGKGVQKALKNGSATVPVLKKAEKSGKKTKKRTKTGLVKKELSMTPESIEARERRTIFVGNVSTKTTRKSLARFFSKYGKVRTRLSREIKYFGKNLTGNFLS